MSLLEVPRRLVPPDATMPADPPLISCLMLTRGRLVPTRLSIDCYRRQTWPNRELIVVCDDPASELPAYIATLGDPSIRYVLTAKDVIGALRNVTLDSSSGPFLSVWDDDDLYHPERLEFQYAELTSRKAAAHFLSRWLLWWPAQRRLALAKRRYWEGSMLARRIAFGSYPVVARREDTLAVASLRERGNRIIYSDQPFAYCYIIHGANTLGGRYHAKLFSTATETFGPDEYEERLEQFSSIFPFHAYREALKQLGRPV